MLDFVMVNDEIKLIFLDERVQEIVSRWYLETLDQNLSLKVHSLTSRMKIRKFELSHYRESSRFLVPNEIIYVLDSWKVPHRSDGEGV